MKIPRSRTDWAGRGVVDSDGQLAKHFSYNTTKSLSLIHISDALISLHWFRAQERVRFKTAVLSYKATHGIAPSYLSQLVCKDVTTPIHILALYV